MLHRHEASVEEGRVKGGRVDLTRLEQARKERGEAWAARGRKRAGEGLREERMEQGRYPEYTVYSHPIPQRALAIATLLLQMKNSEHV